MKVEKALSPSLSLSLYANGQSKLVEMLYYRGMDTIQCLPFIVNGQLNDKYGANIEC
jgi:hypothetical protein